MNIVIQKPKENFAAHQAVGGMILSRLIVLLVISSVILLLIIVYGIAYRYF